MTMTMQMSWSGLDVDATWPNRLAIDWTCAVVVVAAVAASFAVGANRRSLIWRGENSDGTY